MIALVDGKPCLSIVKEWNAFHYLLQCERKEKNERDREKGAKTQKKEPIVEPRGMSQIHWK